MNGAETIWNYEAQVKERGFYCNLCRESWAGDGAEETDRYGYRVHVVRCSCGLVFLNRRMTREAYARFYETGAYRALVSAFHGRDVMATIEEEQSAYAYRLAGILRPWFDGFQDELLDIGGSTGVVAEALAEQCEYRPKVTILEPSLIEGMAAAKRGLNVVPGTVEDLNTDKRWDLITLCQTADHLLDLMGSLKKIKGLLSPDGLFWSDIVDFNVTREVKIDHPFNLTETTYRKFLEKAGFKLLQVNYAPDGKHIGFLCK